MSQTTILIAGAGGPGGVNLTRSILLPKGRYRTIGTDCDRFNIHQMLTHERALVPRAADRARYVAAMERCCREYGVEMILPSNAIEVRALAESRGEISVPLFLPSVQALDIAHSKWASWQVWDRAGLPVPRTHLLEGPEDLERAFDEVETRPLWVRGAGIPGRGIGVASLPCEELGVARAWIDYWKGWGLMIASEFLPGDNLTWIGLFDRGEVLLSQGRQRIRYVIPHVSPSGITGAPAVCHTIHRQDVNEIGKAAELAIDAQATGVYFADLKCDAQDRPRLTEVNAGRFGTTNHFYAAAGVNFPDAAIRIALGRDVSDLQPVDALPPDLYWIRTLDCGPVLLKKEELDRGFTDLSGSD